MNKKVSKQESCCSAMVNPESEKCLKNYLYDNSDLKESKKATKCDDTDSALGEAEDTECWLLQCPKSFDPKSLLGSNLSKMGKRRIESSVDRFSNKKAMAFIAPEKVAEYQLICDNLKVVSSSRLAYRKPLISIAHLGERSRKNRCY